MRTPLTLIQIQDRYIARLHGCSTGHIRRVRNGAYKQAAADLARWGFDPDQSRQIIRDAYDMYELERIAA